MNNQQQPSNEPEYRRIGADAVSPDMERRFSTFEMRAMKGDDEEEMKIGGSAALYNRYTNMGWYAEVIDPGFFDGIDDSECACLLNHDPNFVLGRTRSGTLKLNYTRDGLEYECKLPKSRADAHESIDRGDISQSSFGFTVAEFEWEEMSREQLRGKLPESEIDMLLSAGTVSVRHLKRGRKLYDVSPVTFPAYKDTSVAKRSYEAYRAPIEEQQKREQEQAEIINQRRLQAKVLMARFPNK